MRTLFGDFPLGHDDDLIRRANGVQSVRDDEQGFSADKFGDRLLNVPFVVQIDARRRLVKNCLLYTSDAADD